MWKARTQRDSLTHRRSEADPDIPAEDNLAAAGPLGMEHYNLVGRLVEVAKSPQVQIMNVA